MRPLYSTSSQSLGRRLGSADIREVSIQAPIDGAFADMLSLAKLTLIHSASDSIRLVTDDLPPLQRVSPDCSSGLVLAHRTSPGQCASLDINPSIDVIPPFLLSTTSPEPRVTLPFLEVEEEKSQIQISETAAMDLDMRSCVFGSDSVGHELTLRY